MAYFPARVSTEESKYPSYDAVKFFEPQDLPPVSNRACKVFMRVVATLALAAGVGVAIAGFTVVWYAVAGVAGLWLLAELINHVDTSRVLPESSLTRPKLPPARPITDEEIAPALPKVHEVLADPYKSVEGVTQLGGSSFVFSVDVAPQLIFKTLKFSSYPGELLNEQKKKVKDRYQNMLKVKETVVQHQCHRVIVPDVQLLTIQEKPVVVERRLEFFPSDDEQMKLYEEAKDDIELAQQLATVIVRSQLDYNKHISDIEWRNFPIVVSRQTDGTVIRQILVADTDHSGSLKEAFCSGGTGRGLIHCLFSEKQIDAVIQVAVNATSGKYQNQGLNAQLQQVKQIRLNQLKELESIRAFHRNKEITTVKQAREELIKIDDPASLGLNGEDKGVCLENGTLFRTDGSKRAIAREEEILFSDAIQDMIYRINSRISRAFQTPCPEKIRSVVIRYTAGNAELTIPYTYSGVVIKDNYLQEEQEPHIWPYRILEALKSRGHIFSFRGSAGTFWAIQA